MCIFCGVDISGSTQTGIKKKKRNHGYTVLPKTRNGIPIQWTVANIVRYFAMNLLERRSRNSARSVQNLQHKLKRAIALYHKKLKFIYQSAIGGFVAEEEAVEVYRLQQTEMIWTFLFLSRKIKCKLQCTLIIIRLICFQCPNTNRIQPISRAKVLRLP